MRPIGMTWRCVAIVLILGAAATAAPNRAPLGRSGPEELPSIQLTRLEKDGGAVFGDWFLWNHDQGGHSIFLIHQKTGLTVYLPWDSNGWLNYRSSEGVWYVLFPTGTPSPQNRSDLNFETYFGKKAPPVRLASGKFVMKGWTVTITDEAIELQTQNVPSRISVRASAPEFTHNGRTISK
jgi:hypothetical protein